MKYKDFYKELFHEAITDHTWKIGLAKKIYNDISRDIKSGMNDYKFTYKDHHHIVKHRTGDKKETYPPIVGLEYSLEIYHKELKNCYLIFCPYMLMTRTEGKLSGLWSISRNFKGSVVKTKENNLVFNVPIVRDLTVIFSGEEINDPETVESNLKTDVLREWKPDMYHTIVHELVHLLDIAVKKDVLGREIDYKNRDVEVKAYFIGTLSKFIKNGYSKYKNQPFQKFFDEFINSKEYSHIYKELNAENKKKIAKWLYQIYEKKIK